MNYEHRNVADFHLMLHYCTTGCGRRVMSYDSRCLYCAEEGKPPLDEHFFEALPRFEGWSAGMFMAAWQASHFNIKARMERPQPVEYDGPRTAEWWEKHSE